jgi:RNA polymerase sigma factor (sigma-70 family)
VHTGEMSGEDLILLDGALETLKARDERQHDVVMLRYFAGLTIEQTAAAMDLSPATVKNEWTYARAWLMREMEKARKREPDA